MRVIVCGSRRWHDRKVIELRLHDLVLASAPDYPVIVHGGARGADRIAGEEAQKAGLLVEVHRPDYAALGPKRAPLVRNEDMAAAGADLCIAFWDGRSTVTAHMIAQAKCHGISVEIVEKA